MSRTFFIADTHFNDSDIIRYCNRPFKNVEEQTKRLIENWNRMVDAEDEVWVLGDFFLFSDITELDKCMRIKSLLHGKVNLIMGNHDIRSVEQYREMGFDFVSPYPIILNNFFILSYYPLQLSETTPYYNVYGHVHNDNKYKDNATSRCVCVERTAYSPVTIW